MWTFSHSSFFSIRHRIIQRARGFTVIELLVAVSIIVLITTVVLFRHGQFNSSTLLRSLAYSVALSVRQAQLYGTSVRETVAGSSIFAPSYGVYFTTGNTDRYFLAADLNSNNTLATDGSEDVSPSPYVIRGGFQIVDFCATRSSPLPVLQRCRSDGTINVLSIIFRRPNPDPTFRTSVAGELYSEGCIELASSAGTTRTVEVTNTGQISVKEAGSSCN